MVRKIVSAPCKVFRVVRQVSRYRRAVRNASSALGRRDHTSGRYWARQARHELDELEKLL